MNCRRRLARAAVPAGAALLLLAWVAQAQQEPLTATPFTQPEFVEADCSKWFGRPRGVHIDCGYVSVLEDRAKPDGNVIRLAVARLRGSVPSPHPDPVIYLAGGPGESVLERTYRLIDDARFIWEERDLILLDQRGIGHSEPLLECPDYRRQKTELRGLDLDPDEALQRDVDALLACKRTLSEQGIDVSAYTREAIAADVVDVAEAMGYEAFNLFGNSFGTMLALTVMRDFPDNVRAAILDGVWPPQVNATEARHANAASALEAFFRHCETDQECARRYPGLEQEFWQVVDHYEEHPTTAEYFDYYLSEPSRRKSTVTSLCARCCNRFAATRGFRICCSCCTGSPAATIESPGYSIDIGSCGDRSTTRQRGHRCSVTPTAASPTAPGSLRTAPHTLGWPIRRRRIWFPSSAQLGTTQPTSPSTSPGHKRHPRPPAVR